MRESLTYSDTEAFWIELIMPLPEVTAQTAVQFIRARCPRVVAFLMLALIPVGTYLFRDLFVSYAPMPVLAFSALSIAMIWIFIRLVSGAIALTYHRWLILLIWIIGYFFQLYMYCWYVEWGSFWPFEGVLEHAAVSSSNVVESLTLFSQGFAACVVAILVSARVERALQRPTEPSFRTDEVAGFSRSALFTTIKVLFLVALGTAWIQFKLGFGVAGGEAPDLPFKIAGIVQFFRVAFIPVAAMTLGWIALIRNDSSLYRQSLIIVILNGLMQTILTASRGTLVFQVAPFFLMTLFVKRPSKAFKVSIMVLMVIGIIFWPLISTYRAELQNSPESPLSALSNTLSSPDLEWDLNLLWDTVVQLTNRVVGYNSLLWAVRWSSSFRDVTIRDLLTPGKVTGAFTEDVVDMKLDASQHMTSPGLVGFLVMVGGGTAVVLGSFILTFLVDYGIRRLAHTRLISRFAGIAFLFSLLFSFYSEGTLDNIWRPMLYFIGATALSEFILRAFCVHRGRSAYP